MAKAAAGDATGAAADAIAGNVTHTAKRVATAVASAR
jgi:hypothetical protein